MLQRAPANAEASNTPAARSTHTIVYSTGAAVNRFDYKRDRFYREVLEISDEAIDATRLVRGAPLLNTHNTWTLEDQLGACRNPRIENGQAVCDVRVASDPRFDWVENGIRDGTYSSVSVGYVRQRIRMEPPEQEGGLYTYYVERWQPIENSLVPVPADPGAGVRGASNPQAQTAQREFDCECYEVEARCTSHPPQSPTAGSADIQTKALPIMPQAATQAATSAAPGESVADTAAQARAQALAEAAQITTLCQRHGMADKAADYIASGHSIDQVRSAVLDAIAAKDQSTGGHTNVRSITTTQDEHTVRMAGIAQAIEARVNPNAKVDENGNQYRGYSLLELGRVSLEGRGINTKGLSRMELAGQVLTQRASTPAAFHTSSDFPGLLGALANKRLRQAYAENTASYRMWARRAPNAPDFKNINVVAMGNAPDLMRVNEAGEFTYGTIAEAAEVYQAITYGRIVAITRQSLVNDDLRAFDRLVGAFGSAANRLENRLVYSTLTANANMADGQPLFSAAHNNNAASGTALSLASLKVGRTAMRVQKGLASEELNLAPSYLIVPAALEQDAYQFTSSQFVPATSGAINEFRDGGRTALTPIVEALLDATSATAWYLAAKNSDIDTVEFCYVDGSEGPVIEQEMGFEVDGMQLKCRLDFAAKAIDWRGVYRNVGA